jgi:hypothetical protein
MINHAAAAMSSATCGVVYNATSSATDSAAQKAAS